MQNDSDIRHQAMIVQDGFIVLSQQSSDEGRIVAC